VADFRSAFWSAENAFSADLAAALPGATTEAIFSPEQLHIFTMVAGLWPLCHPSPSSQKMLEEPEFIHLNLNFKVEMSSFLRVLLKGFSVTIYRTIQKAIQLPPLVWTANNAPFELRHPKAKQRGVSYSFVSHASERRVS